MISCPLADRRGVSSRAVGISHLHPVHRNLFAIITIVITIVIIMILLFVCLIFRNNLI